MASEPRKHQAPRPARRRKSRRRGWNPIVVRASALGVAAVVLVAALVIVHFTRSRPPEPRLLGTWQSDADATIADLKAARPVTEPQEQALRKVFGRMKITYTAQTLTTDFDGTIDTQPYQVIRKDGDSVVIKSWSPLSKTDEEFRIRFVGSDTYWVEVQQFAMKECFRRVN